MASVVLRTLSASRNKRLFPFDRGHTPRVQLDRCPDPNDRCQPRAETVPRRCSLLFSLPMCVEVLRPVTLCFVQVVEMAKNSKWLQ